MLNLLLSCLEEAMKRNGDARLVAVSPSAQLMLKTIGADRLFQIFASNADAVNSFHQHSVGMARSIIHRTRMFRFLKMRPEACPKRERRHLTGRKW